MAVSVDAVGNGTQSSASPKTHTHVLGAGSNRLFMHAALVVGGTASNPSYNSVTSTQLGSTLNWFFAIDHNLYVWFLKDADLTTGSNTVSFDHGGIDAMGWSASFLGVDQVSTFGTPATNTSNSGSPTVDAGSATGAMVVDFVGFKETGTPTPGGGQAQQLVTDQGQYVYMISTEDGAATVTMSWSAGGTPETWGTFAVSLNPAGGGGSTPFVSLGQTGFRRNIKIIGY